MPSKFRVRGIFKPLVLLVARGCLRVGMTPNAATFVVLLFSVASATWLVLGFGGWGATAVFGSLVFLTGIMDGVDGTIARLTGKGSKRGGLLDSSFDRLSDAIIFMAPALRQLFREDVVSSSFLDMEWFFDAAVPLWLWCMLVVLGAYMTSYVRARVAVVDPNLDMNVGLLGRSERLLILVTGSIANVLPWTMLVLAVLANGTAVWRIIVARKRLST